MGENKEVKRKGCVVEIPCWFDGIEKVVNDDRREKGLPAYSKALILEAMILEGANHTWTRHVERLFEEKRAGQVGRGRPRKE